MPKNHRSYRWVDRRSISRLRKVIEEEGLGETPEVIDNLLDRDDVKVVSRKQNLLRAVEKSWPVDQATPPTRSKFLARLQSEQEFALAVRE